MQTSFMNDYCSEIMVGVFTDCMGYSKLACYQKEYCAANVKHYGGPHDSVEGYAKDMLYLMVQIQYLDRFATCNMSHYLIQTKSNAYATQPRIDCYCQKKTLARSINTWYPMMHYILP